MQTLLEHSVEEVVRAAAQLREPQAQTFIQEVVARIVKGYREKRKVLVIGNGGSLCDAMHFTEELTGRYRKNRPALAAIALSDPGHMSCVANDFGYEEVFSRGVEALGNPGDILIILTSSGNSPNLLRAVEVAREQGLSVISFLGKQGGALKGLSDLEWIVTGFPYADRVQEAHMAALHIIVELVEHHLFVLQEYVAALAH